MLHGETSFLYGYKLRHRNEHCKYGKAIWPCNANRNEHVRATKTIRAFTPDYLP